ncbi:MAG: hypothetical protein ACK5JT_18370 [Hyphomicrobiaceae bacterium]
MLKSCVFGATMAATLAVCAVAPAMARDVARSRNGETNVSAPTTRVKVKERTGRTKVKVRTFLSDVDVDTGRDRVRVRVPFFDDVIRW